MPQATHHVSHPKLPHGADLYLAPTLMQKVNAVSPQVQAGAMSSVAIRLREEHKRNGGRDPGFLTAEDVRIEELGYDTPGYGEELVPMGPGGTVLERECDDCNSCDIGYHERCRQNGGCPQAYGG